MLRSIEDLFGLTHLGFAGQSGLVPFGPDVYNASGVAPPDDDALLNDDSQAMRAISSKLSLGLRGNSFEGSP